MINTHKEFTLVREDPGQSWRIKDRPFNSKEALALVRLATLFPDTQFLLRDCIRHSTVITFRIDRADLDATLSVDDVVYLNRCGVWFDIDLDCLCMEV